MLLVCLAGTALAETGSCVFSDDFETPAARQKWSPHGGATRGENALWSTDESHSARTSLAVKPSPEFRLGGWQSPPFPVEFGQYYRVTLFSRASDPFFAAVLFSDEHGTQLEGDCNWGADPSAEWAERVFCFKAKVAARTGSLIVYPSKSTPLWVDDVRVETVNRSAVLAWADGIYKTMPPLTNVVSAAPEVVPGAALARLKAGQPLTIALLGDSIAGDLDNSALDVQIERAFPGSRVETVFVGRGATGWVSLRHQIQERVVFQKAQLAILLAISNDTEYLAGDLAEVVRRLRQESPGTELLLVSPHLEGWSRYPTVGLRHRDIVRQVATDEKTGCLDLLRVWQDYLAANQQPAHWLLRDGLHMNERGRQLTARAVVQYLQDAAGINQIPDSQSPPPRPKGISQ